MENGEYRSIAHRASRLCDTQMVSNRCYLLYCSRPALNKIFFYSDFGPMECEWRGEENARRTIRIDGRGRACTASNGTFEANRNEATYEINIPFLRSFLLFCFHGGGIGTAAHTRFVIYLMLVGCCPIVYVLTARRIFSLFFYRTHSFFHNCHFVRSATVNNGLAQNVFTDDAKPRNEWQSANQHRIRFYHFTLTCS